MCVVVCVCCVVSREEVSHFNNEAVRLSKVVKKQNRILKKYNIDWENEVKEARSQSVGLPLNGKLLFVTCSLNKHTYKHNTIHTSFTYT